MCLPTDKNNKIRYQMLSLKKTVQPMKSCHFLTLPFFFSFFSYLLFMTTMFAAQRNVLHRSILYKQSLFCRKPLNRFFITKTLTASHNNRRHPVWNGSVRQHGTHGHHHHDADLLTSLKSSSKKKYSCRREDVYICFL